MRILTTIFTFSLLCLTQCEKCGESNNDGFFKEQPRNRPLTVLDRLRDSIGTATQVWKNGPLRAYDVIHASRTGPISAVYANGLMTSPTSESCKFSPSGTCAAGINGFGTHGEVQYDFFDLTANIKGSSRQTMVVCRCLKDVCDRAVLIRPVNIYNPLDGALVRRTCLYEYSTSRNQYSDCHNELFRLTSRRNDQAPEYFSDAYFNYSVSNPSNTTYWVAHGIRSFTRQCCENDVKNMATVSWSDVVRENSTGFNAHHTEPHNDCQSPDPSVDYRQESMLNGGEECANLYEYAAAAASNRATQQDEYAIGKRTETYMHAKPALVSDTELALTCSAASLGVLCTWSLLCRQFKKKHTSIRYLITVLTIQFLSYILEALPLHMAMLQEIAAARWRSPFSFLDASMVMAKNMTSSSGSAEGNVIVLTAVIGQVEYCRTRHELLIGLTVVFDLIVLAVMLRTVHVKYGVVREARLREIVMLRKGEDREWLRGGRGLEGWKWWDKGEFDGEGEEDGEKKCKEYKEYRLPWWW